MNQVVKKAKLILGAFVSLFVGANTLLADFEKLSSEGKETSIETLTNTDSGGMTGV